jgi:FAD binding domain
VLCDMLGNAAKPHTLTRRPDPATRDHCTFGGMLGNDCCGVHAQMAGKAGGNVLSRDVVLYDGTQITVGWRDDKELDAQIEQDGRVGKIYAQLKALRTAAFEADRFNHSRSSPRCEECGLATILSGAERAWLRVVGSFPQVSDLRRLTDDAGPPSGPPAWHGGRERNRQTWR